MISEEIYNALIPIINIYGDALGWVNEDYAQFEIDYREDVTYTGQTISLEKKLNDRFDNELRRINIQDGTTYNTVVRNRNETGAQTIVMRNRNEEPSTYFYFRNRGENVPSFIVDALDYVPNELGAALNSPSSWVLVNCSAALSSGRLRFTAVRRNLVNNSDANVPNWSGVFNVPRRVVQFATGVNMTFPNFTVSGNFDAVFVVEVLNSSLNQVLLKDSATALGFYKESTTAGNRLALNFGGSTIRTVNTLAEGWHRIELNYNNTTGVWGVKVNNVAQAFVDGLNTLSINGRVFNAVTSSVNQFTGKIAELSISGFAWWKFIEGSLGQSFDTLNTNRLTFSGSFAWVAAVSNSVILDYLKLEGYSVGRNLWIWSQDLTQSIWGKLRGVITTNGDGSFRFTATENTAGENSIGQTLTILTAQTTQSYWVKKGNTDWIIVLLWDASVNIVRQWFNVNTLTLGSKTQAGILITSTKASTIEQDGDWIKVTVFYEHQNLTVPVRGRITVVEANNSFASVIGNYVDIQKSQIEVGTQATPYQPTFANNNVGVIIPKRIAANTDIYGNPLEFPPTMYQNSARPPYLAALSKALIIKTPNANMSLTAYGGVPYGGFESGVFYRITFYYASASLESGVTASSNVMLLIINNTAGTRSTLSGAIANPTTISNAAGAITNVVTTNYQNGAYKVAFTFVPNFTSADAMLGVGPFSDSANVAIVALGVQVEEGLVDTPYQSVENNHFDFSARSGNLALLLGIDKTYNFELNAGGGSADAPNVYASPTDEVEDATVTIEDATGLQDFQVVATASPMYLIITSRGEDAEFAEFSDFSVKEDYEPLEDIKNVVERYKIAGKTFEIR